MTNAPIPGLAVELSDRSLALARGGQVLAAEPSVVFDADSGNPGASAWRALRRQPTSTSTRHLSAVLNDARVPARAVDLLRADLRRRLSAQEPAGAEPVWFVAPVQATARGLGAVLGLATELGMRVGGFVDAAAATVSALGLNRSALVLELGLHHLAAAAVESDGLARRRRGITGERGGLLELYEAWLALIGTVMVKRTRFDPLNVADTEQQLFDALPDLTREVARTGSATAAVTAAGSRFEVSLSRDQFVESAQPVYREVLHLLHSLRPAGNSVALVLPQAMVELPGLREALEQFTDCELVTVPDGFAAAATSLAQLSGRAEDEPVRLLRRIPLQKEATLSEQVTRERLGQLGAGDAPASHILFEGRAHVLGDKPIVVGRSPGAAASIVLPEGLAGVSRRHCTFVRRGDELVLIDHSRFGTFVNGERVAERVRVRAGDRVRIGEPGVELALIAVGTADGGSA